MSEYQCYEFIALDRPLAAKQLAALRAISKRAEISPTRFWNEYQWGDLKADPAKLLERYFDAHLYFADWGTRRLMLRLPKARVDVKALKTYLVGRHSVRVTAVDQHVVLDFSSDGEDVEYDEETPGSLGELSQLRAELMRGDLRCAYLAWLLAVQAGDVDEDATEPPVPAGLAKLTAAQRAMVKLLRIDLDLLAAAVGGSVERVESDAEFRGWVKSLSTAQKDEWLQRAVVEPDLALGGELLRVFRAKRRAGVAGGRRTVGALRALAETRRAERMKVEVARAKRARVIAEKAHKRRLDELGRDVGAAWAKLEQLIIASQYDEAMKLATDLKDLATRDSATRDFEMRFKAMRKRQLRRRGFFDRWKRRSEGAT